MPRTLILLVITFIFLKRDCCYAQNNLHFTHYSTQDGLSDNIVTTLFQDSRGLLWVGTSNGLNWFDGVSFQTIYPTDFDKVHFHSDGVSKIAEDEQGNILLFTDDGVEEYNWNKKTLRLVFPKYLDGGVFDICVDKNKTIWLLNKQYLQHYDSAFKLVSSSKIDTLAMRADKTGSYLAAFFCIDNLDNVWFHYHDIVCMWNKRTGTLENKFNNPQHKKIFNLPISCVTKDAKGNNWAIANTHTSDEIICYNPQSNIYNVFALRKNIPFRSLTLSNQGKIWMTTLNHGVFIFDTIKKTLQAFPHNEANSNCPSGNFCKQILNDKDGNMWIASEHGLYKSKDFSNNFTVLNHFGYEKQSVPLTKTIINDVTAYKKSLLVSTTGGFFRINTEKLKQERFRYSRNTYTLKDHYWFSFFINRNVVITPTWKGILTYNVNEEKLHPSTFSINHPALLDSVPVVSVFKDCSSHLWLAMIADNGIYRWNKNDNTFVFYNQHQAGKNHFPLRHFSCAAEDDIGNIWMGYDKGGMTIFDTASQTFTQPSFAAFTLLNHNVIHDIVNDHHGNLWISTSGGIFCYKQRTQQLKQYNRTDGLISNVVIGMAFDTTGKLWIGNYSGLSRFDTASKQFTNFTAEDGLPAEQLNTLVYDSSIKQICCTSDYAVILFDPYKINKISSPLTPVITSFYVMGNQRSVSDSNKAHLSAKENFFAFSYTAANFSNTADVEYEYKLEGFNKNWIQAGKRQYAGYTNLNGGNYVFKIRATDDNGLHWYEISAPVFIHIDTPFFKTVGFYVLASAVVVAIIFLFIYAGYRAKLKRIVMALAIRNEIASDLHDDVGSSLSSIMLMSEIAKRAHQETQTYFDSIKENAGKIIENMNDIVWAVSPNNDTMEQLFIRMQSFAASLLQKKDITFQLQAEKETTALKLGMEERKNFYLIFKEAIHNAFKYAKCSHVTVHISTAHKQILMSICDDGKGFDTYQKYMGNGLQNMKKRAKEINGKLDITSAVNEGTTLLLVFKPTQRGS